MRCWFPICVLGIFVAAGCVSDRDSSYAPGGTKTIVPFPLHLWKAPTIIANHIFYDRETRVRLDIEIVSIDGKIFTEGGQRTKLYYQVDAGPHVIVVSCDIGKVTWTADFDILIDPGDTVEITGELTAEGPVFWFADVKTGKPVSDKVTPTSERKDVYVPPSPPK